MKWAFLIALALVAPAMAQPLDLRPGDVVPTGNEWLSLPTIRGEDGALPNFNVLSMRDRGLLEVAGAGYRVPFTTTKL